MNNDNVVIVFLLNFYFMQYKQGVNSWCGGLCAESGSAGGIMYTARCGTALSTGKRITISNSLWRFYDLILNLSRQQKFCEVKLLSKEWSWRKSFWLTSNKDACWFPGVDGEFGWATAAPADWGCLSTRDRHREFMN